MQVLAMKHSITKESNKRLWQQAQTRARKHAVKNGIPFHIHQVESQKILPFPPQKTAQLPSDLYRAFRDELLS